MVVVFYIHSKIKCQTFEICFVTYHTFSIFSTFPLLSLLPVHNYLLFVLSPIESIALRFMKITASAILFSNVCDNICAEKVQSKSISEILALILRVRYPSP